MADGPHTMTAVPNTVEKLLLAAPRGYCAGVDRAVQTVERALELHGPPVYVRKEIVHNKHVVEALRERGAVFVEEDTEVPEGAVCVFSAHGVAPSVRAKAPSSAACRRSTRPARSSRRSTARRCSSPQDGYTIVLVGHAGHEEVEGTMGEAPERIVLVQNEQDVDELEIEDPERIAYITQTTLVGGRNDARSSRACASASRRSSVPAPTTSATPRPTARRRSSRWPASCDLMLVIGSRNSSNSVRLVEVARDCGTEAYLIDNAGEVREEWLEGRRVVGISSGASAPEDLVQELVDFFRARGVSDVSEFDVVREDVRFMLPKPIREAARGADA